jgi:protein-arginine kinase
MQVLVIFAYFKYEGNLLRIVMQVDHLELKTLSCYFQNFQELVQLYFIQDWINSFIEIKANAFKFGILYSSTTSY